MDTKQTRVLQSGVEGLRLGITDLRQGAEASRPLDRGTTAQQGLQHRQRRRVCTRSTLKGHEEVVVGQGMAVRVSQSSTVVTTEVLGRGSLQSRASRHANKAGRGKRAQLVLRETRADNSNVRGIHGLRGKGTNGLDRDGRRGAGKKRAADTTTTVCGREKCIHTQSDRVLSSLLSVSSERRHNFLVEFVAAVLVVADHLGQEVSEVCLVTLKELGRQEEVLTRKRCRKDTTVQLSLTDNAKRRAVLGRLECKVLDGVSHASFALKAGAGAHSHSKRGYRRAFVLSVLVWRPVFPRTKAARGIDGAPEESERVPAAARIWAGAVRSTLDEDLGMYMAEAMRDACTLQERKDKRLANRQPVPRCAKKAAADT